MWGIVCNKGILILSLLFISFATSAFGQRGVETKLLESERMRALITPSGLVSVSDTQDSHRANIVSSCAPWAD